MVASVKPSKRPSGKPESTLNGFICKCVYGCVCVHRRGVCVRACKNTSCYAGGEAGKRKKSMDFDSFLYIHVCACAHRAHTSIHPRFGPSLHPLSVILNCLYVRDLSPLKPVALHLAGTLESLREFLKIPMPWEHSRPIHQNFWRWDFGMNTPNQYLIISLGDSNVLPGLSVPMHRKPFSHSSAQKTSILPSRPNSHGPSGGNLFLTPAQGELVFFFPEVPNNILDI